MAVTICLVQARYASSRLFGKAILELCGHPLLWHVVTRCRQASTLDRVVVATGESPTNQPIIDLCRHEGWDVYAGSDADVLSRFAGAARAYRADVIVRVSGDSPLIDPDVIDRVVRARASKGYRYASNAHPPTYPDGLDTEAVSAMMLDHVAKMATLASDREHCTAWLSRNLPSYQWANVTHEPDLSGYRLCVDTAADLEVMREVMRIAGARCTWEQAVKVLDAHPKLRAKNGSIKRNEGYALSVAKEMELVGRSS